MPEAERIWSQKRDDDLRRRRSVAIKVLRPEIAAALGPERFLREIEVAARLTHPHILPLFDSGNAGDTAFYGMPFIEGNSLSNLLGCRGTLPADEALRPTRTSTASAVVPGGYAPGGSVQSDGSSSSISANGSARTTSEPTCVARIVQRPASRRSTSRVRATGSISHAYATCSRA